MVIAWGKFLRFNKAHSLVQPLICQTWKGMFNLREREITGKGKDEEGSHCYPTLYGKG